MGRIDQFGCRLVRIGVVLALVASCSICSDETRAKPVEGWWDSEPELAPENFDEQASESLNTDGGDLSSGGTKIIVPEGALAESADVTIREPLGSFGGEFGGPIVGIEHDEALDGPVTVEWDVADLTPAESDTLLLVRWDDAQQRWVPGDVEPAIEDGTLTADLQDWSFWSWIANVGQTGQEIVGRRADAPKCNEEPLHDWVAGVVDPDEGTNAAAVRVCFENDRDEIVTMRVVNNRTFGQFIHIDGFGGWEWVWNGEDELSAVQAVRAGAAAVFNDDRRIFVPPLHEVAVGIARPDTGGSHFIEFRNESTAETFLADVVMFAVSKLDIPTPGVERVGVLIEAVLKCALPEVVRGGAPTDLNAVARLVVSTVTSCIAQITDETSDLGVAFRTMLSRRIVSTYPTPDAASDAMRHDRLLRSASRALKLLSVVEAMTYLGDVAAEHLVGDLRWSVRGAGSNSPLGEWQPDCGGVDRDSNLIYRNLALQDEFADTSIEYHDFPRWPEAAAESVIALVACDTGYLTELAAYVRVDWGDREAAGVVADAIEALAAGHPPLVEESILTDLIDREGAFNQQCRGESGSLATTWAACDRRAGVYLDLNARGLCYEPHGGWDPCPPGSAIDDFSTCPDTNDAVNIVAAGISCAEAGSVIDSAGPKVSGDESLLSAGRFNCSSGRPAGGPVTVWCGDYGSDVSTVETTPASLRWEPRQLSPPTSAYACPSPDVDAYARIVFDGWNSRDLTQIEECVPAGDDAFDALRRATIDAEVFAPLVHLSPCELTTAPGYEAIQCLTRNELGETYAFEFNSGSAGESLIAVHYIGGGM